MVPNTFYFFGAPIPLYGFFVFLGVIAFIITTTLIILIREKQSKDTLFRLLMVAIPCLAVLYISAFLFDGMFHSIKKCSFSFGGITWLGGVIGLLPFLYYMLHKYVRTAYGKEFEFMCMLIPGIVIGHAFGRIGCFFGGCCFGQVTDLPIGGIYPAGSNAAILYPFYNEAGTEVIHSQPVLPTQLFEAGFEFILFLEMILLPKKTRPYNLEMYCVFYAIFRFILEFFRADDRGGTGFFLSPSQLMSIILFIGGILVFLLKKNIIFHKAYLAIENWKNNPPPTPNKKNEEKVDYAVELTNLKKLYDDGIITEEDFIQKKQEILDKIGK